MECTKTKTGCCENNLKKVTHVIFDVDGVLIDSEKFYIQALTEICTFYGKQYTQELRLKHQAAPTRVAIEIIVDGLGIEAPVEEFMEKFVDRTHELLLESELMPGAERLVRHFHNHNIPIAMATSSTQKDFKIKFGNRQEFVDMFHHYVLTEDPEVKQGKPHGDIFLVAASRFAERPKPHLCLVVEDSPNGIKAALNAGMQCVMLPDQNVPQEIRNWATVVVDRLDDFKPEIFGLPPRN